MRYRILGKTGLQVSELGFGSIPIMHLSTNEAVTILRHAHDQGITLYDTANAYSDSEDKIGRAFQGMRGKVIIATKTLKRDRQGAEEDIERSLKMLRTDYIDIYQLHQMSQETDWEKAIGPDGAMEAIVKAQLDGKIKHIGVTSHNLAMAIKIIKTGLFATIQFPFNFIEDAVKDELHPLARELAMGILVMKPFAGGVIDDAALAFKFLRQFPDAIPLPGYNSVESVDQIVSFYFQANTVTATDFAAMAKYRYDLGQDFCRRCEYCQPCPQGVMITSAMQYRVLERKMPVHILVKSFAGQAIETVVNCIECGECIKRCPYNLEIPEILKRNYERYEKHKITFVYPSIWTTVGKG